MYGHSYDAETQVSTAGLGDPKKVYPYLKAIVPSASVGGQYEYSNRDGVPFAGQALLSNGSYLALTSLTQGETTTPQHNAEKLTCVPELMAGAADLSGDMTPFWAEREYRPGAKNIRAATLWVHGLDDFNVQPITIAGFFDRLPAATPKAGLFGHWEHNYPDKHAGVQPAWARQDFLPMVTAWYDRHLKGLDTGTEDWPTVQVQDSTGQWRAEPEYPATGGPAGALALGPEGALGASKPTGSTAFREGVDSDESVPGSRAVFTTPPLADALHLTGAPVADLWLTTDRPDGHVAVRIDVLGADGEVLTHDGSDNAALTDFGFRSLRHLAPMANGYFAQASGDLLVPTGTPLRVPVRLMPTDLVVPKGGRLRLTVAGALASPRASVPSGTAATITVLHDCEHASALRFVMPRDKPAYLNVRETDEKVAKLPNNPAPAKGLRDGGGLATAAAC
jgi:X-Pro dipeptidyl-peptidase